MFGWLFRKPVVPDRLKVEDVRYWLDGGTTEVIGIDPAGSQRVIKLTQHLIAQWGGVGWLYLDRYKVPRRSQTEQAIVALLRSCLGQLHSPSHEPAPEAPTGADMLAEHGTVIFGSPSLAAAADMGETQRMVFRLSRMLAYVESDDYGKVTEYD